MSQPRPKFVLFAHNATYDKLHQVATLGLTAAAMGKDVIVILLFWTIKKLAEGKIDHIDFPPEYAASGEDVARLLKEKKVPKISEMLAEAKLVGTLRLIACSAALASSFSATGLPWAARPRHPAYLPVDEGLPLQNEDPYGLSKQVDEVLGLPAIISLTADAETTLFI